MGNAPEYTGEDLAAAKALLPFLYAGRRGLSRSKWQMGQPVDYLVAPIVLAVLVEVGRRFPLTDIPLGPEETG